MAERRGIGDEKDVSASRAPSPAQIAAEPVKDAGGSARGEALEGATQGHGQDEAAGKANKSGGKPPITSAADLQQQLEYYFSDKNLRKDVFLRSQMDAKQFVQLEVLQQFPRVKAFLNTMPADEAKQALWNSIGASKEITLNDRKTAVARITPFEMHVEVEGQDDRLTVVVKNLAPEVTKALLWELCLQVGPVRSVRMPKDESTSGIAFCEFEDEWSVLYASWTLNTMPLYGRPLVVVPYGPKLEMSSAVGHVFVRSLMEIMDESHLWALFQAAGKPVSVKVMRDTFGHSKCFGFVTYESMEEAQLAVNALHGLPVMSTCIDVSISHRAQKEQKEQKANEEEKPGEGSREDPTAIEAAAFKASLASRWISRGMGFYPPSESWATYAMRLANHYRIHLRLPKGLTGMKDAEEAVALQAREAQLVAKLIHAQKRQKTG